MKKVLKSSLSLFLAIAIIFGSAAVGFTEIDFGKLFAVRASAASTSDLTFRLNSGSVTYSVIDCNTSATGTLVIPSIYNGKSVTSIAGNTFANCTSLKSITIPDSVTSIGNRAFVGCTSLTSITIPDSVTSIGWDTFKGCTSLTSVVIGNGVTSIGDYAFRDCRNLTSITIPDSVTDIGTSAFEGCENLMYITIPDSVTSIGNEAFYNTGYYNNETNWENGVLYIDNHLIKMNKNGGCVIKEGIKTIASYAFCNCTALTYITIPASVTSIGNYAFEDCTNLKDVYITDIAAWCGIPFSNGLSNPLNKGANLYLNGELVTDLVIPDSVTSIGEYAFSGCTSLASISIPKSVTSIDEYAFYKCTSLASVTIPDSVTSIGNGAFYECKKLKSVTIPDGVTIISYNTFRNCINLTSITIPDSVTSIGDLSFANCTSLTAITIPDSVTSIGEQAFASCTSLTSITIPNSVTSVGKGAFFSCYNITSATIGNSVSYIDEWAFNSCESLTSVTFLGSETNIYQGALCPAFYINNIVEVFAPCDNLNVKEYFDASQLKLTHSSVSDWIIDTDACVSDGLKHKECTSCGEILEKEVIPATGIHLPSDWINDANTSCSEDGIKHKECTVCGITLETEVIPATGEHTISYYWIIDALATAGAPGSKHRECTVCHKVLEIMAIPQLKPTTPKATTENSLTGVLVRWNAVDGAVKYNVYRRQGGSNTWTLVGTTTSTSLTDTKVSSGIYYVYSVRAYNNAGQYSDFVSANTQTRKFMAVPKLKGISNATNGLYITWNPIAGVTNGYRVYRRGAGSTYWTYLGTTKNTYFTDTAVKNNSGEYFRYTVIADGGYHSKFDTTGLYLRRLSNPTLKSATSASAGITVKWTPVKGCLGYYVYRKTANSGWVRVGVVNGVNASSYLDKTAKKGTTYTYTVRAVCGNVTSYFNSGISCKDKY